MNNAQGEREKYEHIWSTGRYRQSADSLQVASIIAKLEPAKVLDIGTGNGYVVAKLLRMGIDAYGVDITAAGWKSASRVNPKFRLPIDRLQEAPAWSLPFLDSQFDCTFSVTVLEHLPPEQVLVSIQEIVRVTQNITLHWIGMKPQSQFGHAVHLSVHPLQWWSKQFESLNSKGLEIRLFEAHAWHDSRSKKC